MKRLKLYQKTESGYFQSSFSRKELLEMQKKSLADLFRATSFISERYSHLGFVHDHDLEELKEILLEHE